MIEVPALDRAATLARAGANLTTIMQAEAEQLAVAAHWADLNHPDSLPPATTAFEERRRRLDGAYGVWPGGEGTVPILPNRPAELGLVLQTSAGAAKHLIADALDLRHRLPTLWAEVQDGRIRGWKARKVAQATRHLPLAVMGEVDRGLTGLLPALPWTRFEAVLDATVQRADSEGARFAEAEAASRRFVALGRDDRSNPGLKTLIARGAVLDILTFLAAVNRIADLLADEGDEDPLEVRRSKAVGILGQPDRALAFLAAHAGDGDDPDEAEPDDADPDDAGQRESETDEPAPEPDEPEEPGTRSLDLTGTPPAGRAAATSVRVQLYVHLTDAALNGTDPAAVCRVEGVGPVTAATVRTWLQRTDVKITVRPVVVPGDAVPVDAYEVPHRIREAVLLRNPASAYPWSWCVDRRVLQLDHVVPYLALARGGPPGQTDPVNLAPLVQTEHQRKTSGRWQERTPAPGVYLWRSPHGWVTLVTNQGTFPLGSTATAERFWRAAAPDVDVVRAA